MSNVIAGVVRGQYPHLEEHIAQKKAIYLRYKEGLKDLPVQMNPYDANSSEPNYWLSCLTINPEAMCRQMRGEKDASYEKEAGKTCPTELLEALSEINAEGRPIWKPMHMQPMYKGNPFVTRNNSDDIVESREMTDEAIALNMDIFDRGLCLPSDNKMTAGEQDIIIDIIRSCFG